LHSVRLLSVYQTSLSTNQEKSGYQDISIITRDSIICYSAYMLSPVCLSVCLSHGWIIQKRLRLGLWNFHHTVAPSL